MIYPGEYALAAMLLSLGLFQPGKLKETER
jgi:hypothetical protein